MTTALSEQAFKPSVSNLEVISGLARGANSAHTLAVHRRPYQVFAALFHSLDQTCLRGEIPWTEFVYAMSSFGFAVKQVDGSAWLFRSQGDPQRGNIFHEPHPSSKIPLHIARRHGPRLQRACG